MKSVSLSWCCTTLSKDIFCNVPLELLSLHIAAMASCKTVCNYHEKFVITVLPLQVVAGHCQLTPYFLLHQAKQISPHLCEGLCLQLVQSSLEQCPRWRFHNLNGQHGSVFDHSSSENIFYKFQQKFLLLPLRTIASYFFYGISRRNCPCVPIIAGQPPLNFHCAD